MNPNSILLLNRRRSSVRVLAGLVVLVAGAAAHADDLLTVTRYDMLNGQAGAFSYWDDSYNGSGNTTQDFAPLSGGVGDLTNGVVATQNWFATPAPYVGWRDIIPDITFFFDGEVLIDSMTLYLDDSNGNGGVSTPGSFELTIGIVTIQGLIPDGASGAPVVFTFDNIGLSGSTARLRLFDGTGSWVFMSEAQFRGVPTPGALAALCLMGLAAPRRRR